MNLISRASVALALTLALSACISVGSKPEAVSLRGLAPVAIANGGAKAEWSLRIERPRAGDPLDGPRIVLSPAPGEYGVYAGVRWREPLPLMFESLLVRSFEASGRLAGVTPATSIAGAQRALEIDVEAFQAEYRATGDQVRVAFSARLIEVGSARIVAARRFESQVPLASRSIDAVVDGFDRADAELVPQVIDWALAAAPPAKP